MGVFLQTLQRSALVGVVAACAYMFVLLLGEAQHPCAGGAVSEPSPKVAIEAFFGVEMPVEGQGRVLIESDRVPLVVGTTFGWVMLVSPEDERVHVREELILPEAPKTWQHTEATRISSDGRVAITEDVLVPKDGWISNGWTITEGDPPGPYQIRVYLDGRLVKSFGFLVDDAR